MVITGENIGGWISFSEHQIAIILKFILKSWESYNAPSDKEDKLTRSFCRHLQIQKKRSFYSFQVRSQIELSNIDGNIIGRIDLMFFKGYDEDIYFSFECKRLRVNFPSGPKSLAGDYVTDGMYRYFNGQYASGLDKGGMLGYVMDGQMDHAIQDVTNAVHQRRIELYMDQQGTLRPSSVLSSHQIKETEHKYGPQNGFVLYHIFLPFQKN